MQKNKKHIYRLVNCVKIFLKLFIFSALLLCSKPKETILDEEKDFGLIKLKKTESGKIIKSLGSVSYLSKAEVSSKVLGRIEYFKKEEGDRVFKNEVLAKVETLNLEIQLEKDKSSYIVQEKQVDLAKAKLLMARQRVERDLANIRKAEADVKDSKAVMENLERSAKNKKELYEMGAVSETELKSVETSLNSAQVAYFKAQRNLENINIGYRKKDLIDAGMEVIDDVKDTDKLFIDLNTSVEKSEYEMAKANLYAIKKSVESTELLIQESYLRSPLSGIVASRTKDRGEAVKENEAVYIVVDTDKVLVRFNVTEEDSTALEVGNDVRFTIDALENREYLGKIFIVSPIIDPQTRSIELKVLSDNPNTLMKPGMFVRGKLIVGKKNTISRIPKSALIDPISPKKEIYVLNAQGYVFKKEIDIYLEDENEIQAIWNFDETPVAVTKNVEKLSEGEKLEYNVMIEDSEIDE